MFCGKCGSALVAEARFCSVCGAPVAVGQAAWAVPVSAGYEVGKLARPRAHRAVAGVCAGLAKHYGWELTWVRVLTVLITFFSSGAGLVAYIVFWIVMPEESWMLPATTSGPATTGSGSPASF